MKITKISVKNYRSLENVNISDTRSINMIFGINNSGKSNILKFIETIFKRKTRRTIVDYVDEAGVLRQRTSLEILNFYEGYLYDEPFLVYKNDKSKSISFIAVVEVEDQDIGKTNVDLLRSDGLYRISKIGGHPNLFTFYGSITYFTNNDFQFSINEIKINDKVFLKRNQFERLEPSVGLKISIEDAMGIIDIFNDIVQLIPSNRSYLSLETFGEVMEASSIHSSNIRNFLFDKYIDASSNIDFVKFVNFLNNVPPSGNLLHKFPEELSNYPFNNIDISFARFKDAIEIMAQTKNGRYPIVNYGTGTQQLLYILSFLFFSRPKVLLIEEIELNLSLIYQEVLIHILKSKIEEGFLDQVYFTSHSDQFRRNDFRHYRVTTNIEGATLVSKNDNPKAFYEKLASDIQSY